MNTLVLGIVALSLGVLLYSQVVPLLVNIIDTTIINLFRRHQ